MSQITKQVTVVSQTTPTPNQIHERVAFFNEDGEPLSGFTPAAAQSDFVGADITALKVELNAFLVKLEAAGIVLT